MQHDEQIFTELFVRERALRVRCDVRSYKRELREPGSVRGLIGALIRSDIERVRARFARQQITGLDLNTIDLRARG